MDGRRGQNRHYHLPRPPRANRLARTGAGSIHARPCAPACPRARSAATGTTVTLQPAPPGSAPARRVLDRREVARIAPLRQRLDRAPQQLARAGLRQQRHEMDGAGSRDRAELPVHRVHDLLAHLRHALGRCHLRCVLHHRERHRNLALERIGHAHHRHLGDSRMRLHGLLDLARAEPMAGDVDHVVGAAQHEVVAVGIARRPVERRVRELAAEIREIGLDEARVVAPDRGHAPGRQRRDDRQHRLFVGAGLVAAAFAQQPHVVAVDRETTGCRTCAASPRCRAARTGSATPSRSASSCRRWPRRANPPPSAPSARRAARRRGTGTAAPTGRAASCRPDPAS